MSASKSSPNLGLNSSVAPPDSIDSISRIFLHRAQGESTIISAASLMKPRHLCLSGMIPCIINIWQRINIPGKYPRFPVSAGHLQSCCLYACASPRGDAEHREVLVFPFPVSLWPSRAPSPPGMHSSLQPKGSAGRHPSGPLSPTGCHLDKAPASLQCCPGEQGFDEHAGRPDGPYPTGLHYRPLLCSAQVVNNLCPLDVP